MFKFIEKIKAKANKAVVSAKVVAETALTSKKGEGYIDTAVKWIIGIVIGGVILVALYALFKTNLLTTLETKLNGFFNYSGT
ncbi:MAG: hypothetical protein IJQ37_06560 [Clostridia bacterium]|nr:hypothetical protein [Clostridia bacterium]